MLWQVVRRGRKRKGRGGKGVAMLTSVLNEGPETGVEERHRGDEGVCPPRRRLGSGPLGAPEVGWDGNALRGTGMAGRSAEM